MTGEYAILDYRIQDTSPAIDAGANDAVPADVTSDLGGNQRFVEDASKEDAGLGECPRVDIGAYEVQIPGDINGDGIVSASDLLMILAFWGPCGEPCPGDINDDNHVGTVDLLILLATWGGCS